MRRRPSTSSATGPRARSAVRRELVGKRTLGRQTAADRILALVDELAQLVGDLPVQPAGFYGLERQAPSPARSSWNSSWLLTRVVSWSDQLNGDGRACQDSAGGRAFLLRPKS